MKLNEILQENNAHVENSKYVIDRDDILQDDDLKRISNLSDEQIEEVVDFWNREEDEEGNVLVLTMPQFDKWGFNVPRVDRNNPVSEKNYDNYKWALLYKILEEYEKRGGKWW